MSSRIALFLCDTPIPAVRAEDGDYTDIFNALLRKSRPDIQYSLDPYDVREKMEYPKDLDTYDAIILTGSAASAYENLEWINLLVAYIASVAEEKPHIKLIGICFGHQILARALGGECVPNGGLWEVGPTTVDLSDVGQQLFGKPQINIQQMHRDHVPEVPKSCHLLGSTSIAPNQGFIRFNDPSVQPSADLNLRDIQIFTVQGHPEFTKRIVSTVVDARAATGVIDKDTAESARKRADWHNDGVDVIGRVIWKIISAKA
ncbi:class I glutamine amidotransferase-like protein [Cristinia sonorae]|uniref:Class I glutamine amidotransferase-like protein n=1 Tax=Cristinia sonorae TaxID=1940300 RepID=A0A8K0UV29_9AGAR|nr:class I glutamine amidotransferase-like protein [Cristinia sonorae]